MLPYQERELQRPSTSIFSSGFSGTPYLEIRLLLRYTTTQLGTTKPYLTLRYFIPDTGVGKAASMRSAGSHQIAMLCVHKQESGVSRSVITYGIMFSIIINLR